MAEIYLLNLLAGNLTVQQLSAGAAPFRPFSNKLALAAKVYLVTLVSGVAANPSALVADAACWQCIPNSARLDVETYLFASSDGMVDPGTLTLHIGPYKSLYPIRDQVLLYLLSLIAGSPSIASIMAGAKCLTCLSTARLEEIFLKQLCAGLTTNLIPNGSRYGPTAEFDLVVLANTSYLITWGANDLSVTICGTSYSSTGTGTTLVVNTGACTLMQFFGTFAGTTVTVQVNKIPMPVPTPTGFTWTISAGIATAAWDTPPAGISTTEVWISLDGVSYSLASAVVNPGTSYTKATAVALYAKIRWTTKSFPGYSAFTAALLVDPYEPVCGVTTFDAADYMNNSLSKGCGWNGAGVSAGTAFSQFSYQNEANIWQLGGNNNFAWVRTLNLGTNWNRIRIGMMHTINDTNSANIASEFIFIGMNHGTLSPFGAGGNFIGTQYGGGAAWSYTVDPSGDYIQPGATDRYAVKIVAGVSAVSSFGSNGVMQVRSSLHRTIYFVDVIKGNPNYTVRAYRPSLVTDSQRDFTFADLITGMQAAENLGMTISGKGFGVFSTTLAFDETGGALDSVYALLTGNPPSANAIGYISAVAVRKLA